MKIVVKTHLTYTTPPPCSALRRQPMGTCTGTACLSSPASQSFPPFIAPRVLRSTPQRYIYHTSTSVFVTLVMFQSRGWRRRWWEGRGDGRMNVGLGVGGVRRAHSRPYPLSCFMATVLNGACTSITASRHSEPSDSGRRRLKTSRAVLSQGSLSLLLFYHLSSAAQDIVPQSDE